MSDQKPWPPQGEHLKVHVINDSSDFIFLKDFIYLFMRDTERERQRHRQGEKQPPSREPNVGLDPGSPRSRPGLKVALNR